MTIQIERVRIKNFRALRDVEVILNTLSLLVGTNNAGKTTFLRALNAVLGVSRTMLNKDDLFIDKDGRCPENNIIIDIKIIPVDSEGNRVAQFQEQWAGKFGAGDNIGTENDYEFFAFRSTYNFEGDDMPEAAYTLITDWTNQRFGPAGDFNRIQQVRNNIRMYYIDAQRDIEEDLRMRTSYFGKMAARIEDGYASEDIEKLSELIKGINESAVDRSPVLTHLKQTLAKLNQTTQTRGTGVDITPFSRNIRDLHKGMKVDFQDNGSERFSMEYHGMGTRSWASILTAGAYIDWELKLIAQRIEDGEDTSLLFPIIALEEPEAHLHPNAQRTLYSQMKSFLGQKIISTHSPYIAGQAGLEELRHFYKAEDTVEVTQIEVSHSEEVKIAMLKKEIEDAGRTPEIYRQNNPVITSLEAIAATKLSIEDERKVRKEIMQKQGDILFSKAIILFEGETELFSLPVFAEKYFDLNPYSFGLTFVDVGGKKNYYPFLRFAKLMRIPCFIFSDADGNTINEVKDQIIRVFGVEDGVKLTGLPPDCDYEKYLIEEGFAPNIVEAIDKVEGQDDYISLSYMFQLNGHPRKGGTIRDYQKPEGEKEALLDCMRENKTRYAEMVAVQIIKSDRIPDKCKEIFNNVNDILKVKIKIGEDDFISI